MGRTVVPSGVRGSRGRASLQRVWCFAFVVAAVVLVTLGNALGAEAAAVRPATPTTFVPQPLLDAARADGSRVFDVIVQGRGRGGSVAANAVADALAHHPGKATGLKRRFAVIDGVAARLSGAEVLELAARPDIRAITSDAKVIVSGNSNNTCNNCPFEGLYWSQLVSVAPFTPSPSKKAAPVPQAPGIAVVDSGIDASNSFFGNRVVKQVSLVSGGANAPGDSFGHGTFVAGLAAGLSGNWGGASPTSKLISLDVVDDAGLATTSDVLAAADWIYQNKDAYGIRVANFSLTGTQPTTFMYDPLDKAIEKLWFSGVVVVASAGNYGNAAAPSGVPYAPANDPFVITAGAIDMNETLDPADDFVAPWSAYGYTLDGFAKPDLSAPGRYMIGTVPAMSSMPILRPDRLVATGWMWMSGTSFAAPVIAGAAADVLAVHPTWTPDQVKGALMLSAEPIRVGAAWSGGVGDVDASAAAAVTDPPNPNLALDRFLVPDPNGGPTPVFDAAAWASVAAADPSWSSTSWASANWTSANWTSANWTSANWTTANWTSANWTSANWTTSAQPADVQVNLLWLP